MTRASSADKGKMLERLVAWLHEGPDVQVQMRVRLPTIFNPKKKREIDVLVTGSVAGHKVRLAIECKSERQPIGTDRIGAFESKLRQVGIPPALGIFVSANGYTSDALDHARSVGITPLIFRELTEDRLDVAVSEAVQSVVYLLPDVVSFNLLNELDEPIADISEAFVFYDEKGQPAGTIPDFVWDAVRKGTLEPVVGKHVVALELPSGWHNVIEGRKQYVRANGVTVDVLGLVLGLQGEVRRHTLVSFSAPPEWGGARV